MNEDQLKKLPQWAQREFSRQADRIKTLEEDLNTVNGKTTDTNVFLDAGYNRDFPLPKDSHVRFGENFEVNMGEDGELRVWCRAGGDMAIIPNCGNVVHVRHIERS